MTDIVSRKLYTSASTGDVATVALITRWKIVVE